MSNCNDYPTPDDAKTFKLDAITENERVTLDQDRTNPASDGKTKKTMWGIENDATLQRDEIEQLAENQRDQFNATFQVQFTYAHIGNISDFVGDTLTEAEKLNSYQYPDDSDNWYGPIQSQTFPITIPADPTVQGSGWSLVNGLTQDNLGSTNVIATGSDKPRTISDRFADLHTVSDFTDTEPSKQSALNIYNHINNGVNFTTPNRLFSISDAWAAWSRGDKFPVVFFGDSTTDGAGSTIDGTNPATVFNKDKLVSGIVPNGFDDDHDETEVPNAYPNILQRIIRSFTGNAIMRCYNAGYRSQRLDSGWACEVVHNAIYANPQYSDSKMIFINFGLNDNWFESNKEELATKTYQMTKALVLDAYNRGVQPVLMTSTATGRNDGYGTYQVNNYVDNIKRQLALEMNLEILEIGEFFFDMIQKNGDFLTYQSITSDDLHPNDLGYLKQSEYMFKEFAGSINVPDITNMQGIGPSHPAARLTLPYSQLSSGTTESRGVSQRFRNVYISPNQVLSNAGGRVVDFYLWCDDDNVNINYEAWRNASADSSLYSDYEKIMHIETNQNEFLTGGEDLKGVHNLPDVFGGQTNQPRTVRTPSNMLLTKMRYGLNRVSVVVPSDVELFISSNYYLGSFSFTRDGRPAITTLSNYNASNPTKEYQPQSGFKRVVSLESYDALGFPFVQYSDIDRVANNCATMNNIGDSIDIKVNASFGISSGVVLGFLLDDPTSSRTAWDFDVNNAVVAMDTISIYNSTTGGEHLKLVVGSELSQREVVDFTDVLKVDYESKTIIVRLTRVDSSSVSVTIHSLDNSQIGSISGTLTTPESLKMLSSFYVGGAIMFTSSSTGVDIRDLSFKNVRNAV